MAEGRTREQIKSHRAKLTMLFLKKGTTLGKSPRLLTLFPIKMIWANHDARACDCMIAENLCAIFGRLT